MAFALFISPHISPLPPFERYGGCKEPIDIDGNDAALLGVSMIEATGEEKVVTVETVPDFSERWREKLVTLFAEVLAHEEAVGLISQGYFQGNEVLFTDARECLTASGECARQLIVAYNWFAAHEGKEPIDIDGNDVRVPGHVEQLLNSWVRLSRARALSGMGKIFEARHEVLSLLRSPK